MTRRKALSMRTSQPGRAHEAAQRLGQRARQLELGHRQHHARIGCSTTAPAGPSVPGEDACAVGLFQALRRQLPAGRQQAGRVAVRAQRRVGRGQRLVVVDPVQHQHAPRHYGSVRHGCARGSANCLTPKPLTAKLPPRSDGWRRAAHEDRLHRRRALGAVFRPADEGHAAGARRHRGRAQQALRHLRLGRGVLRRHHGQHAPVGRAHRGGASSRPSTTGTTSSWSSRAASSAAAATASSASGARSCSTSCRRAAKSWA